MTPQNIMERLLEFARAAGQRAMNYQYKLQAQTNYLKNCAEVRTVVTKADLEISRQFRSFVESQFAELNPLIVDEESVSALGHKPFEKINNAEYVFIIDPIDGTLTYANQMALYGISVGVYQNGKPAYLVDLGKAFEWLFNIKIGDYHQKHEDVIKRKPGKITEFLNGLADLIRKEHDKKGYR